MAAGLLYPLSGEYIQGECQSSKALGDNKTLFVIDGIELSDPVKEVEATSPATQLANARNRKTKAGTKNTLVPGCRPN
jgi:hypothetical protein